MTASIASLNILSAAEWSALPWLARWQRLLVFNRCMAAARVLTAGWMLWGAR